VAGFLEFPAVRKVRQTYTLANVLDFCTMSEPAVETTWIETPMVLWSGREDRIPKGGRSDPPAIWDGMPVLDGALRFRCGYLAPRTLVVGTRRSAIQALARYDEPRRAATWVTYDMISDRALINLGLDRQLTARVLAHCTSSKPQRNSPRDRRVHALRRVVRLYRACVQDGVVLTPELLRAALGEWLR
jgi:hypothetical protein